MKSYRFPLRATLVLCWLLIPFVALAETPETVMKEILAKIKAESNSSPIVEYVDWETAYAQAPEQQKQVMKSWMRLRLFVEQKSLHASLITWSLIM